MQLPASGDGWHDRNTITVFDRRGFFLQVANVFVIEVDIHKGTQFAFVRIKMPAQLRMLRHEPDNASPIVPAFTSTAGCLPAYCRKGVGMWILGIGYT